MGVVVGVGVGLVVGDAVGFGVIVPVGLGLSVIVGVGLVVEVGVVVGVGLEVVVGVGLVVGFGVVVGRVVGFVVGVGCGLGSTGLVPPPVKKSINHLKNLCSILKSWSAKEVMPIDSALTASGEDLTRGEWLATIAVAGAECTRDLMLMFCVAVIFGAAWAGDVSPVLAIVAAATASARDFRRIFIAKSTYSDEP